MLKLTKLNLVGVGEHRSGWPYCVEALQPILNDDAVIKLDDFVERTFLYDTKWHTGGGEHKQPWVGVFHHPPDMPDWYLPFLNLTQLDDNERWQRSLPLLRMVITLGPNSAAWAEKKFPGVPVVTMKHPTGRPMCYWTPEQFEKNKTKKLLQVGWFLRNTQAIYQVKCPEGMGKAVIRNRNSWVEHAHTLCFKAYAQSHPERVGSGPVLELGRQSDIDYDFLLSRNVVFMEVVSAVANNTVVECIARNTPICINRHPGPEYYLGKDYPLFYTHLSQVPELLTPSRILAAHKHIKMMRKGWIRGGMFCEHLRDACNRHLPECRSFTTPVNDRPTFTI